LQYVEEQHTEKKLSKQYSWHPQSYT